MNAIELLKEDHDRVKALFKKVEDSPEADHKPLFEKIRAELEAHTHIEETIFYPKMKAEEKLKDLVLEGVEEHHQVKMFIRELSSLSDKNEKFDAKLTVLIEDVKHHVKEEEEEMFPLILKAFDEKVLDELGAEMDKEKKSYKKSIAASNSK